jgi:hypothetical protein
MCKEIGNSPTLFMIMASVLGLISNSNEGGVGMEAGVVLASVVVGRPTPPLGSEARLPIITPRVRASIAGTIRVEVETIDIDVLL